ncbi:MAG: type II toxin-antitoxin system HicB family antitoxin [Candidatus Levybacteria bacterium]|nr:type II toxin-antitoxin system HicB family antitoxin [Candidatus Levybacteria bacterium]
MKKQVLHTIVWREKNLFVAKFLEIELASQGKTRKEALRNLEEALALYLEDEPSKNLKLPSIEDVSTNTFNL